MNEQQERADFEAWCSTQVGSTDGTKNQRSIIDAWRGWEARASLAAQGVPADPVLLLDPEPLGKADLFGSTKATSAQAQQAARDPVTVYTNRGAKAEAKPLILGREIFKFDTFNGWVNHAQRAWKAAGVRSEVTICIDAIGRPCRIGRDFARARDEGAFPVRVYLMRDEDDPDAKGIGASSGGAEK